jgi:hypothetical protein
MKGIDVSTPFTNCPLPPKEIHDPKGVKGVEGQTLGSEGLAGAERGHRYSSYLYPMSVYTPFTPFRWSSSR